MDHCPHCTSTDLERHGIRTDCIDCGAYAIDLGSKIEWVSPRTIQRVEKLLARVK